jgi:hypothetical protein
MSSASSSFRRGLNLVNISALPIKKNQYLVESGPLIHYSLPNEI